MRNSTLGPSRLSPVVRVRYSTLRPSRLSPVVRVRYSPVVRARYSPVVRVRYSPVVRVRLVLPRRAQREVFITEFITALSEKRSVLFNGVHSG
ncbi:unnamed protein product [Boreogadus saida]